MNFPGWSWHPYKLESVGDGELKMREVLSACIARYLDSIQSALNMTLKLIYERPFINMEITISQFNKQGKELNFDHLWDLQAETQSFICRI